MHKIISLIITLALLIQPLLVHAQAETSVPDNTPVIDAPAPPRISIFRRLRRMFSRKPRQQKKSDFITIDSLRPQSPNAIAFGANKKRQIVGMSMVAGKERGQAFLWKQGTARELPGLHENGAATAYAINTSGIIVGYAQDGGTEGAPDRAVRWKNGTIERLPLPPGYLESHAYDINDAGDIGGDVSNNKETHAVIWRNNAPAILSNFDGTFGLRVTADGELIGNYRDQNQFMKNFIWNGKEMKDYAGEVLPDPSAQWQYTFGKFPFAGNIFDANQYLEKNSPWQITNIERVYPNGDLVGFGIKRNMPGTFAIFMHIPALNQSTNP